MIPRASCSGRSRWCWQRVRSVRRNTARVVISEPHLRLMAAFHDTDYHTWIADLRRWGVLIDRRTTGQRQLL